MKQIVYNTSGTCARQIIIEIDETTNTVRDCRFIGGCNGNTQGICQLVKRMKTDLIIERLKGIKCGAKGTSCPDQLACALEEELKQ